AGIPSIVLLPENRVSIEQLSQPIAYGARTLALQTDFDGCMRLVAELTRARPVYLLNSMNSIRIEGQKSIVWETIQQLDWRVPDWIVVPVGNAGNISALGKGLLEWRALGLLGPDGRLPRLAGVQSDRANPMARSYRGGFARKEPVTAGRTVASAVAHHEGRIAGVSSRRANRPVSLPATFDAVVSLLDNDRVRH